MYKVIIDSGATYLFHDNGANEINEKEDMMGFLINNEHIVDLINNMEISEFYAKPPKSSKIVITKKEAMYLYRKILEHQNKESDFLYKYKKNK